jgi:hypothetical protein
MRRVTRGPILILTCDPLKLERSWPSAYSPEVIAVEARRYPPIASITNALGHQTEILSIPISLHCADGFSEAYYGRRECLLESGTHARPAAGPDRDPAGYQRGDRFDRDRSRARLGIVAYGPYSGGQSFHRQPLLSTCRMPLITR